MEKYCAGSGESKCFDPSDKLMLSGVVGIEAILMPSTSYAEGIDTDTVVMPGALLMLAGAAITSMVAGRKEKEMPGSGKYFAATSYGLLAAAVLTVAGQYF